MTRPSEYRTSARRPGLGAGRWLLFLTFLHTIPSPFIVAIIIGTVPAAALLAGTLASFLGGDRESFFMGMWFIVPTMVFGGLYYGLATLLSNWIFRIERKAWRTTLFLAIVVASLLMAMAPVYTIAGHGGSSIMNVMQLGLGLHLPGGVLIAYGGGLLGILSALTYVLHSPEALTPLWPSYNQWDSFRPWRLAGIVAVVLLVGGSLSVYKNRTWMLCKPLAEKGHAWAQVCLARELRAGLNAKVHSDVDAVTWYERAAAQGNAAAIRELLEISRTPKTREPWLRVLAAKGEAEAQFQLFDHLRRQGGPSERMQEALKWLTKAAAQDHPQAQFELGWVYLHGQDERAPFQYGVSQDRELARSWWERAAGSGHRSAMGELAWRYEKGSDGFPLDLKRARVLLEALARATEQQPGGDEGQAQAAAAFRARSAALAALQHDADQGDIGALVEMGSRLLQATPPDPEKKAQGLALLEQAAEQGHADIQFQLGGMYILGWNGISQNLERGRNWWDRAAAQNHIRTLEYVADAYMTGRYGYPVDLLKAKPQLEVLVAAYENGLHQVASNPEKVAYWGAALQDVTRRIASLGGTYAPMDILRAKAEAGDAAAQYQLGQQLLESYSPKAHQQAVDWWIMAAANGHHEAQFRLVSYYERGDRFVEKDDRRIVELLEQAAAGKHPKAMLSLGLAYEKGRYGLVPDPSKAKTLYEELIHAGDTNQYGWNVDERFLSMPRLRLKYVTRLVETQHEGN